MTCLYFNLEQALTEHRKIINLSGGLHGYRDQELIASILSFVKNDDYYPGLEKKVTYLLFSIAKNHAFLDGNKRTAIALAAYLMEINGYGERVGYFIVTMENIVVWVVENKIDTALLEAVVTDILKTGIITEQTQLELITRLH